MSKLLERNSFAVKYQLNGVLNVMSELMVSKLGIPPRAAQSVIARFPIEIYSQPLVIYLDGAC
jgi:hypothetical protein